MSTSNTALVTGATSGLGFEAAAQLAESGWSTVIITGRTEARASEAKGRLVARTGKDVFRSLIVDLDVPEDVARAAAELKTTEEKLDVLILNLPVPALAQVAAP